MVLFCLKLFDPIMFSIQIFQSRCYELLTASELLVEEEVFLFVTIKEGNTVCVLPRDLTM